MTYNVFGGTLNLCQS